MSTQRPPDLLTKSLGLGEITVLDDEEGIIEAFVSGIGNKDSDGDIIQPGAFDEYLKRRNPKGVWSHDWDRPIAKTLEVYEVPPGDPRLPAKMQAAGIGGLYVKAKFNLNTQDGRDAYETVKFFGDEAEFSIGYQVHDQEYDKKSKAMLVKTIELFEWSPVLFGANSLTSLVSIKAALSENGEIDLQTSGLTDVQRKAVCAALKVVLEEDLDDDNYDEKPWHIEERDGEYCVIKDDDGEVEGCHETRDEAEDQLAALYASEDEDDKASEEKLMKIESKAIAGSFEERYGILSDALSREMDDVGYAYIYATFPDNLIFFLYDFRENTQGFFQVSYTIEEDSVEFGDPVPVDVVEVVVAKAALEQAIKGGYSEEILDGLDFKAGRVLSAKNRNALQKAIDSINSVLDDATAEDTEEKAAEVDVDEKWLSGSLEEAARERSRLVIDAVRAQLIDLLGVEEDDCVGIYATGTYDDHVVLEVWGAGIEKYFDVSYSLDGEEVTIEEITEVELQTTTVRKVIKSANNEVGEDTDPDEDADDSDEDDVDEDDSDKGEDSDERSLDSDSDDEEASDDEDTDAEGDDPEEDVEEEGSEKSHSHNYFKDLMELTELELSL